MLLISLSKIDKKMIKVLEAKSSKGKVTVNPNPSNYPVSNDQNQTGIKGDSEIPPTPVIIDPRPVKPSVELDTNSP